MYGLCQHLKPVSGCIWSFSTGMKSCSGWKFGAFWLVQVTRKIIGRFRKEVTIVIIDDGEGKSESWLDKWQSGKLCTESRVQCFSRALAFWGFRWRCVVFAKSPASSLFGMESRFARVLEDEILAINEATVLKITKKAKKLGFVGVYWLVENYFLINCNKIIKMHLVNGKNPRNICKHCQLNRKQSTHYKWRLLFTKLVLFLFSFYWLAQGLWIVQDIDLDALRPGTYITTIHLTLGGQLYIIFALIVVSYRGN